MKLSSIFKKKKRIIIHILLKDILQAEVIKTKISFIKDIDDVFLTPNSSVSDIVVITKCREDDIKDRVEDIRIINGVKSVEYYILLSR